MENKEIKITPPQGYEVDKENSTFECIKFKKKEEFKEGDFVFIESMYDCIGILWKIEKSGTVVLHVNYSNDGDSVSLFGTDNSYGSSTLVTIESIRKATKSEKKELLDYLDKKGYVWNAETYRVEKKCALPKTWKEFCETHPKKHDELYLTESSEIRTLGVVAGMPRHTYYDRNLLLSKELAEAMLALCQLIQLRDCYNDGWMPDWIDSNTSKWAIYPYKNILKINVAFISNRILTFKTKELCDEFFENFRDLIEVAKPLL